MRASTLSGSRSRMASSCIMPYFMSSSLWIMMSARRSLGLVLWGSVLRYSSSVSTAPWGFPLSACLFALLMAS